MGSEPASPERKIPKAGDGGLAGARDGDRDGATDLGQLPTGVRRARVLELVRRRQFASVAGLSAAFGVSEVTIRNDLDVLAEEGHLQRVRGGAVHAAMGGREAPFEQALVARSAEKAMIGAAAARLVESGQTIFLDVGTTAAAVARAVVARPDLEDLTVFTNGLRIALELEPAIPRLSVILTGGTLRRLQHSLVNPFGTVILDQVHAHLGFLECDGIDPEAGVTGINAAEAEVKRLMMRAARRRVLVADGSKIGQVSLVHLYGLDEIDLLVTDPSAEPDVLGALRDRGVEAQVAGA
jgi:DeoR family transcriptional regulator of aga operon